MDEGINKVTVLLADNHYQYRDALKQTLELEDDISIVGETDNWAELEEITSKKQPHIVLIDPCVAEISNRIPGGSENTIDDLDAIKHFVTNYSKTSVLILTMRNDTTAFKRAIKAGAQGYALKEIHSGALLIAIRAVAHGQSFHKQILTTPPAGNNIPFLNRYRPGASTLAHALVA